MVKAKDTSKEKVPELVLFGEAVREQRKARGFSQEAFGDSCGIDRSYMGGIERGEHNLALVNILKIIAALDMQPSEFFKALDKPVKVREKMQAAPRATREV
ncbi:helix-turn-helix domain-containing protein [Ralstonia nicotianae]